ncbi:MAG: BatD family protein [Fluviicola sp.]|nr:BatD family protein [Fluviicola sp.]
MKKSLLIIQALLCIGFLYAQDPEIILSIDPVSADIGELITITVKSNVQGELEIDNLPSSFVQGYDVMSGMEQEMDYNTGKVITYYYISQTGAIGKKGKYTIGPAFVKKGNKTYPSNTIVVNIGEKTEVSTANVTADQLKEPAFGTIQTNKTSIYEGEAIVVFAKIYSHFEPTHLEGYRSYEIPGTIDKKELGNVNRIIVDREYFKNMQFYTFDYDKNVIFPSGTGQFKISPYSMKLNQNRKGYQFKSNYAIITIKPLPNDPPSDFIGAVGNFTIEQEIEQIDLNQGDVFKILIRIIGSGNLQNITEPSPTLPKGFIIYGDPEVKEDYIYNSHGTEGQISYKYNIQVNKSGVTKLPPTTVSFFDPKKEKYVTVATATSEIKVKEDKNYIASIEDEEVQELNAEDFMRKSEVVEDDSSFFGSVGFWTGVSTPILASFLFLFLAKKREESADEIEQKGIVKKKSKQVATSMVSLESQISGANDNEFYSQVEKSLKTALEVKIPAGESMSKKEFFSKLSQKVKEETINKAKNIFEKCDQFRYGFPSDEGSKQAILEELKTVLEELKE